MFALFLLYIAKAENLDATKITQLKQEVNDLTQEVLELRQLIHQLFEARSSFNRRNGRDFIASGVQMTPKSEYMSNGSWDWITGKDHDDFASAGHRPPLYGHGVYVNGQNLHGKRALLMNARPTLQNIDIPSDGGFHWPIVPDRDSMKPFVPSFKRSNLKSSTDKVHTEKDPFHWPII